jgi:hypothetical protein
MKNEGMTELQREALDHLEKPRQEGLSISAYARTHGIPGQRIYDAVPSPIEANMISVPISSCRCSNCSSPCLARGRRSARFIR